MAGIWTLLAVPLLIVMLFVIFADPNANFKKVGAVFWIISVIAFLAGFCLGSLILMAIAVIIIYLRASGKLGH